MQLQWIHAVFCYINSVKKRKEIHNRIFSDTHIFVLVVEEFVIHDVVRVADPFPNGSGLQEEEREYLTNSRLSHPRFYRAEHNTTDG